MNQFPFYLFIYFSSARYDKICESVTKYLLSLEVPFIIPPAEEDPRRAHCKQQVIDIHQPSDPSRSREDFIITFPHKDWTEKVVRHFYC